MIALKSSAAATATLAPLGDGRFKVSGALNAETVGALLERSEESFKGSPKLELDLAGVPEGDSAGLALLIEWLRLARQNKQDIHFANVPAQIAALAVISEVEELLAPGASQGAAS